MVQIKRAYEPPSKDDGYRVLVERLWPRGVTKEALALDAWAKDLAPSTALRKWFGHDPDRWHEFVARYRKELASYPARALLAELERRAESETVTLVYGARDEQHNSAVALRDLIGEAHRAHVH